MAKVVDTLKATGLWNNTVLLVTGDNGGDVADGSNNHPYFSGKGSAFEGGIKVIGFWTGGFLEKALAATGTKPHTSDHLFLLTDTHATFSGLAGLRPKADSDGVDQWAAITKKKAVREIAVVLSGTDRLNSVKAAVYHAPDGGRFKLLHNPDGYSFFGMHIALYSCATKINKCSEMPACLEDFMASFAFAPDSGGESEGDSVGKDSGDGGSTSPVKRFLGSVRNRTGSVKVAMAFDGAGALDIGSGVSSPAAGLLNAIDSGVFQQLHQGGCQHFDRIRLAYYAMMLDGSKAALDTVITAAEGMVTWINNLKPPDDHWSLFDLNEVGCVEEGGQACFDDPTDAEACACNHYCTSSCRRSSGFRKVQRKLHEAIRKAEEQTTKSLYSPVNDVWADFTQFGWFVNPWRQRGTIDATLCEITDSRTGKKVRSTSGHCA